MIRRTWERWVAWCGRDEDARPQALARIFGCSVLIYDLLRVWVDGLLPVLWVPASAGGLSSSPNRLYLDWGFGALFGPEAGGVVAFFATLTFLMLALVGVATRPALVLAVVCYAQLAHLYDTGDRAIDRMLRTVFLILAMGQGHRRFALGGVRADRIPAWPADLIRYILVLMYLGAGFGKWVEQPAWMGWSGVPVLYRIMADPMAAHMDPHAGMEWYGVLRFFGWGTIVLEVTAPLLLTRWAPYWAILGVAMHVGIAMFIDIGMFSYGMLGLYPLLLVRWFEAPPWRRSAGAATTAA